MLQDLRYAWRTLWKNPGFSLVAVIALALGIGANTAIFSVVYAVLLRPLPFHEPSKLVAVFHSYPKLSKAAVSPLNYLDYKKMAHAFETLGAESDWSANLTGAGDPERLDGRRFSASMFPTLGVTPQLGRAFTEDEDQPGHNLVVILGNGLWERRFGRDPKILNQTITINGTGVTVVGVMPRDFRTDHPIDIFTPLALTPRELAAGNRGWEFLSVYARMRPGVTLDAARADMTAVANQMRTAYYRAGSTWGIGVFPLREELVGDLRGSLVTLFLAVGVVLLIACANVASLLLARAASRGREIAIRRAIGASRARLVQLLLTESVLLAVAGGALGMLVALWASSALTSLLPVEMSRMIPGWDAIGINLPVLAFTMLVSVATGVLFGLAPALQTSTAGLNTRSDGRSRFRSRHILVVAEFSLSLLLLAGAGLLIRSFWQVQQVNPGFVPDKLLALSISPARKSYPDNVARRTFFARALDEIRAIPGVESAGVASILPLSGDNEGASFMIDGVPLPPNGEPPHGDPRSVSAGYFETMKIPLLRGRFFNAGDGADSAKVIVIDDLLAQQFFPGQNPIGRRMGYGGQNPMCEIIGVVSHVKHYGLDALDQPEFFFPMTQFIEPTMNVVVRASTDPVQIAPAVRAAIARVDAAMPIYRVQTMQRVVEASMAQRRLLMTLLGVFAVLALALAAVGIYGVMSYGVAQQMHEIGIRMALGAQRSDVMYMVTGRGLRLAAAGAAIGVVGGLALARLMRTFLFGVGASDPATFLAAPILLCTVALAATWIPARRATRVDPIVALRNE